VGRERERTVVATIKGEEREERERAEAGGRRERGKTDARERERSCRE